MVKKAIETTNSNTRTFPAIALVIIFLAAGVLFFKYVSLKNAWRSYSNQIISDIQKYRRLNGVEDAQIIATTIVTVPSDNPLYKQASELENYILKMSKQTERDLVVLDKDKNILADTFSKNVGQVYTQDKKNEVKLTLSDGKPRAFEEKSKDYPIGVQETVVPLMDQSGLIVGAVIMSSSQIFN